MKAVNRVRITNEVKDTIKRYPHTTDQLKSVGFILDRFFHHLLICMVHGIKIKVFRTIQFYMLYTYHSFIPRRDRKKYIFPAKAFGYSFFLNAESKEMRKYGYSFRTDKKVIAKITDYLEGDIVYKLIKQ